MPLDARRFALAIGIVVARPGSAQHPPGQTPAPPVTAAAVALLPTVVGLTRDQALNKLAPTHLTIVSIEAIALEGPTDVVTAQHPAGRTPLAQVKAETILIATRGVPPPTSVHVPPSVRLVPPPPPARASPPPSAETSTLGRRFTGVPDLYGLYCQELAMLLSQRYRLRLGKVTPDSADTMPAGRVFHQDPPYNDRVEVGTLIDVWCSLGPHHAPDTVTVPDVSDRTTADATRMLLGADLIVRHVDTIFRRGAAGRVWRQDPLGGTVVHPKDSVTLTVALPPPQVLVPPVTGRALSDAAKQLAAAGLRVGTVTTRATVGPDTTIVSQNPKAHALVDSQTAVDLVENRPPILRGTRVPNLTGMSESVARRELARDSLQLGDIVRSDMGAAATVIAQNPPADEPVSFYQRVNVTLGTAKPDALVRLVHVPPVVGLRVRGAYATLRDSGLTRITLVGDAVTPTAVVDSQAPIVGTLVAIPGSITLRVVSIPAHVVPRLVGRSEQDAHDRAEAEDFHMNVRATRRELRWRATVTVQEPIGGARDRGDGIVDVELAIPLIPPLPTGIAVAIVGIAVAARRKLGWPSPVPELRVSSRPEPPQLERPPDSLVRSSIALVHELHRNPVQLEFSGQSIIKSVNQNDA